MISTLENIKLSKKEDKELRALFGDLDEDKVQFMDLD